MHFSLLRNLGETIRLTVIFGAILKARPFHSAGQGSALAPRGGKRRTPLKKQELIRRTLRMHLRQVIDQEALGPAGRVTTVEPLPRGVMAKTYKRLARIEKDWDRVEQAATKAQGIPSWLKN